MESLTPHKRLECWKKSFAFVKEMYQITSQFPSSETFGLTSQIRRAAVSIPVNIAEGSARNTKKEFANFLHISLGSAAELDTLLLLAVDLNLLKKEKVDLLLDELSVISKLINGLIKSLRKSEQ
ncbi:four helix bundle protein [Cytophagales bacterium LB-30]|uniref:Four helix bundle protein n=1 Tax=Shiella aurantiaca TaxID=3058365 RepID=A0ABT8F6W6_9BACT|nr:four helix bundle protein [Shiella aurantiaca]MDN4165711.1 four helix bundle protein [Shiella aurantiaca]